MACGSDYVNSYAYHLNTKPSRIRTCWEQRRGVSNSIGRCPGGADTNCTALQPSTLPDDVWRGLAPDLIRALLRGVEDCGLPARAKIVLTGYLGSTAVAEVVTEFIRRARRINPDLSLHLRPCHG